MRKNLAGRPARIWLDRAVRRMASRVKPDKVILFGSYASGRVHKDSDLDLLVILREPADRHRRYAAVDKALGEHLWPLDLLVRGPEEVESRLKMGDSFFLEIMKNGEVLYES